MSNRDPVYLYEEIMTGIKQYIEANQLNPGDRIPTEAELCEIFQASRISIRRAIKELVEEGILEIIRGKGTFVNKPRKEIHLLHLQGFTEGLTTENDIITKDIISMEKIKGTPHINKVFNNQYDEYVELIRKVYRNNQILSLDYAYLPTSLYPSIENKIKPDSSTFKIINDEYQIKFNRVCKELEFVHPTEELQKHLEVSRLTPLILVDKVIYDECSNPVHYSKYYLIADLVKLRLETDC
ncbi:MAG TPA: GntR family transcriptional regulator [Bacillus sp. (in: firmicutes)]|nr:GntR family transcriptional regulator [Bacillus sp. (in: firmicutes)]